MSTGHPSRHGFVQCAHCGTWIPVATCTQGASIRDVFCADSAWCRTAYANRLGVEFFGFDASGSPTEAP